MIYGTSLLTGLNQTYRKTQHVYYDVLNGE